MLETKSYALELYLKEIRKYPLLSLEEELLLGKKIKEGDRQAEEKLVNSNLRLVVLLAKKYTGRGLPLEDLIGEGNLGIMEAVKKYDYKIGVRFTSYACFWIRRSITRAIYDKSRTIRIPIKKNILINKIKTAKEELITKNQYIPTLTQISEYLGVSSERLYKILIIDKTTSLDFIHNTNPNSSVFKDERENIEENAEYSFLKTDIKSFLKSLEEREADVIRKRFGLNEKSKQNLKQISSDYNICPETVRKIQMKAIEKLRIGIL